MAGGRPTDLTPELQRKLLDRIRKGVPITIACQAARIDRQTWYNWKRRGQEEPESIYGAFFGALKEAECQLIETALDAIAGGESNWQSRAWLLERKWPEEFGTDRHIISDLKQMIRERKRQGGDGGESLPPSA